MMCANQCFRNVEAVTVFEMGGRGRDQNEVTSLKMAQVGLVWSREMLPHGDREGVMKEMGMCRKKQEKDLMTDERETRKHQCLTPGF